MVYILSTHMLVGKTRHSKNRPKSWPSFTFSLPWPTPRPSLGVWHLLATHNLEFYSITSKTHRITKGNMTKEIKNSKDCMGLGRIQKWVKQFILLLDSRKLWGWVEWEKTMVKLEHAYCLKELKFIGKAKSYLNKKKKFLKNSCLLNKVNLCQMWSVS